MSATTKAAEAQSIASMNATVIQYKALANTETRLLALLGNKVDGLSKVIGILTNGLDDTVKASTNDTSRSNTITTANDLYGKLKNQDAKIRQLINETEAISDIIESYV
jgi:hypothetical protein